MKARVLIIDDEEGIRFTFEKFLTKEGYEVAAAEDFNDDVELISV